jgi:protease-4
MSAPRRSSGWGCGWIFLIVLLVGSVLLNFLLMLGIAALGAGSVDLPLQEKHHSGTRAAANKIAILAVDGVIMDGDGGFVDRQVEQIMNDPTIKAVVLRIDSPGGSVSASDFQFHKISEMLKERQIPCVVSMGFLCASGGYYVAMAQQGAPSVEGPVVYAEPTTWVGSIGVYVPLYNAKEAADKIGIEDNTIATAPLKTMGSMMDGFVPGEKEVWEGLIGSAFTMFKQRIAFGRPALTQQQIDDAATGQIYTTEQALNLGLVDKEGFLDDAIDRALELANLTKEDTNVVEFEAPFNFFASLQGASKAQANPLAEVANVTRPQTYYLWGGHQQLLAPDAR